MPTTKDPEEKKPQETIPPLPKPGEAAGQLIKLALTLIFWVLAAPGKILSQIKPTYLTPLSVIVGSIIISASILAAANNLPKTSATTTTTQSAATTRTPTQPTAAAAKDVEPLKSQDHVRGSRNARILLIEYSDLECPFCKRFHPTAQQVLDKYKGQVAWVYRHFPLDQIHQKADKEAEAIECAGELGGNDAFWKLTDKIFEVTPSNNGLNLDDLPKLAAQVGLDQTKFKACLDSGKYTAHVEEDYQGGIKAGVTGTPGNILLDTKTKKTKLIPGAAPLDNFSTEIDNLLKGT